MNTVLYHGVNIRLLLRTQLFNKFSIIKLTTGKCIFCNRNFCWSGDQIIGSDTTEIKRTFICNFASEKMACKGVLTQYFHPTFDWNAGSTKLIHYSAENGSKSTPSSTITDSTKTEDFTFNNTEMSQYVVGHDTDKTYFYIRLQESTSNQPEVLAKLEYKWLSPSLVELYHTEVPPQFQGKGIAKFLAKAAFDAFCEQDVLMRPTCTYLQKYLRENQIPRYMEHIEKGFDL
uniref:Protein NATD1 n=2 Tax=Arion vulgaris TaxID=1028688 RepID=A0A0B6YBJ4_9EUPU